MDGELVMCSVENNNNNNKITRKQQNIKTMCIPQTSIYFYKLTFVSVCIILQLYKPIANSKQQFHTHK